MSMKTDAQPAVWLGCLSCNNSGYLVGRWFPCDMIEEVTLAEVHGGQEYVYPGCEEVLALDSEYLPRGVSKISQRGRLPGVRSSSTSEVTAGRSFSPGTRTAHLPWTLTACRRPASSRRPIRAAGTHSVSSWSPGPTLRRVLPVAGGRCPALRLGQVRARLPARLHRCRCPLRRCLRLPQPVEEGCRCECGVECVRPCRTVQMARG